MTYGDHYRHSTISEFTEYVSEAGELPFTVFDVYHPPGDFPDPASPEFALFAITRGNTNSHFRYNGRQMTERCRPGTLGLAPPEVDAEYTTDGPLGYVGVALPTSTVKRYDEENNNASSCSLEALHEGTFRNDALASLIPAIAQEAKSGHLRSGIVADALTVTILGLLNASARPKLVERQSARLSKTEVRRLTQFVEENMERSIRLFELATLLDVSEAHLVRACKTSLGLTPHRFVMKRRLERACAMIVATSEPLAQIALEVGFSSQSHMTDAVRRLSDVSAYGSK